MTTAKAVEAATAEIKAAAAASGGDGGGGSKRGKVIGMPLAPLAERIKRIKKAPPHHTDPVQEVARLYDLYITTQRRRIAIDHSSSPRRCHSTGKTIECRLPGDTIASMQNAVTELEQIELAYRWKIERVLREVPIYQVFLSKVWQLPLMLAATLVALVDIRKCEKPSQLQRFCGTAPSQKTGNLERPGEGNTADERKRHYVTEIRTQFYLWSEQLNRATRGKNMGKQSSKYANRCLGYLLASAHDPRNATVDGKTYVAKTAEIADRVTSGEYQIKKRGKTAHGRAGVYAVGTDGKPVANGELRSAAKFHQRKGYWKAADLFLFDLYGVWRALEGLRSWSSWYEWQRDQEHGGERCPQWVELTPEEALAKVGDVGKLPATILLAEPGRDAA